MGPRTVWRFRRRENSQNVAAVNYLILKIRHYNCSEKYSLQSTVYIMYKSADKSLARPGWKQANVSVRKAWISFGALRCRKKKLMTARVSMLLKSRASLTCFRDCFLPGQAKDFSAPRIRSISILPLLRLGLQNSLFLQGFYSKNIFHNSSQISRYFWQVRGRSREKRFSVCKQ